MGEAEHFQAELQTARLLLRRPQAGDAHFIMTHASDFQVARNLAVVPHPYPEGAAEEFIARSLKPEGPERVWIIQYGPEDHAIPVGVISLRDDGPSTGSIGYWVAPWLWGFGFASEAVSALVGHAAQSGYACLKASVHEGNAASARVLVKAGFVSVGEGEEHSAAHRAMVNVGYYEVDLRDGARP
jgi:RimJ/RimL family protein N-acetyltransferase